MNFGAGAASAVGAVVGLFAGAFAGKALGGTDNELVGATLGGAALGAFTGTILTAPDTVSSTGTAGLPRGVGAPGLGAGTRASQATAWKGLLPASPCQSWSAAQWANFKWRYNLPQAAGSYTTLAQVQTLGNVITAAAARLGNTKCGPGSALNTMQKLHTAAAANVSRLMTSQRGAVQRAA